MRGARPVTAAARQVALPALPGFADRNARLGHGHALRLLGLPRTAQAFSFKSPARIAVKAVREGKHLRAPALLQDQTLLNEIPAAHIARLLLRTRQEQRAHIVQPHPARIGHVQLPLAPSTKRTCGGAGAAAALASCGGSSAPALACASACSSSGALSAASAAPCAPHMLQAATACTAKPWAARRRVQWPLGFKQ